LTPARHIEFNWATTAIFITVDEGGGYYDSGYVQPLDFFGDGTRIPMIVVSPFTKQGHISVAKFIERNWHIKPLTGRGRRRMFRGIARPSAICSICLVSKATFLAG
jgi:phospholipase C